MRRSTILHLPLQQGFPAEPNLKEWIQPARCLCKQLSLLLSSELKLILFVEHIQFYSRNVSYLIFNYSTLCPNLRRVLLTSTLPCCTVLHCAALFCAVLCWSLQLNQCSLQKCLILTRSIRTDKFFYKTFVKNSGGNVVRLFMTVIYKWIK